MNKTPLTNRSKSPAGTYARNQAEIKAAAAAKKQQADMLATNKKTLKSQQDALKLAKAKAIFDIQKIQIEAALKGKISEEDRVRLLLMKAIAAENLDDIDKYTKALDAAQAKTKELQTLLNAMGSNKLGNVVSSEFYKGLSEAEIALEKFKESGKFRIAGIGNPVTADFYRGLSDAMIALERFKEAGGFRTAGVGNASAIVSAGAGGFTDAQNAARLAAEAAAKAAAEAAAKAATTVVVNIAGTVTAQADLEKAIQDAINASRAAGNVDALAPKSWRGEV
jgi:hypothetical protein